MGLSSLFLPRGETAIPSTLVAAGKPLGRCPASFGAVPGELLDALNMQGRAAGLRA